MSDVASLLAAAVASSGLAALYFGGLWWTVRRLPTARNPAALYFGSLVVRLAALLAALLVVLAWLDGPGLAACLAGFTVTRLVLAHWASLPPATPQAREKAA